ncbi:MAG: methionyl-tRNA formyltransferase [Chloroflexota bacterium]
MDMPSTRIIFMGSPEFALPTLRKLTELYRVVGVVTQPDRPAGRGRKLTPPPVKTLAQALGLVCIQPQRLRHPQAISQLHTWNPDLIVVAAFGQILPPEVLDIPLHGCLNVHASLLPRWRGAAPIPHAILNGDSETGITIMRMDEGLDTGPILNQSVIPIQADDTTGSLHDRLAHLGAELLIETLPAYLAGKLQSQPQDDSQATYAPLLKKEDGCLDFTRPAEELERRVRAFHPWPGAFTMWQNTPLKILKAHVVSGKARLGERVVAQGLPALGTAKGLLVLDEVQPAGKKSMSGGAFLLGARDWIQ